VNETRNKVNRKEIVMAKCWKISLWIVLTVWFSAAAADVPQTDVALNLEYLLVDSSGVHPMDTHEVHIRYGGGFHKSIKLDDEKRGGEVLICSLGYRMIEPDKIELTLEREVVQGPENKRKLPSVVKTISTLESWITTIFDEDDSLGGKLVLRVVPMLRQKIFDEDFGSWRVPMRLANGPLVEYIKGQPDQMDLHQDRVHHRAVNGGGVGLRFGILNFGVVRVSHYRFAGAKPCGWVRKARYYFRVGGRSFGGWSDMEILPEDPDRPGKGWALYCTLDPDPTLASHEGRAFYGGFDPFVVD
jgi:hypothetical protein